MVNKFNFILFITNISFISFVSYNNYQLNNELNTIKKHLNTIEIDYKNLSSQVNISKLDIIEHIEQVDNTINQTFLESTTINGLCSLFTGIILMGAFIYFFNINLSVADEVSKNTISTIKGCAEVEIEAFSKYSDVLQHVIHSDTKILDKKLDKVLDLTLTSNNLNQNVLKIIDPQILTSTIVENSDTISNVTSTITPL